MKSLGTIVVIVLFMLFLGSPSRVEGQAVTAASREIIPSVFGGLTGTYTGLQGGRNLGITAGADIGFRSFFYGISPSIEGRGTYPIAKGQIAAEKSALGGVRLQKKYGFARPYVDYLFGRGELDYQNGGLVVSSQLFKYISTTTNVSSPGVGVEADLTSHFGLRVDAQFQHWNVPFDPSGQATGTGHLLSIPVTVAMSYRFGFLKNGHPIAPRDR